MLGFVSALSRDRRAPRALSRAGGDATLNTNLWQRTLAVFMAVVLAWSLAPSTAWAEEDAAPASDVPAASSEGGEVAAGQGGASVPEDASGGAGASGGADGASGGSAGEQGDAGTQAEPAAQSQQPVASGAGEQVQTSEAEDAVSLASVEEDEGGDEEASLLSVDGKSYCVIQDTKDKDSYYSRFEGSISSGMMLWANMYDYSSDDVIPAESGWSYQWMSCSTKASSTSSYTPIAGQTSQSLTITNELAEQLAGSYIIVKVSANGTDYYGPSSYSPSFSSYYTPGPVLAPGSVELYSVDLSSVSPTVGDTLTATAYKGSYYSKTAVTEGVTYTWQYTEGSADYSSSWTDIAGATGPTFTVTDEYVGKSIRVAASAGANTVELSAYSAIGPFKAAGQVDIYAVSFTNETSSGSSDYKVGETIKVRAKEQGASSYISADKLNFQWQVSDSARGTFTDIEGATSETLALTSDLAGKYVNCLVSSKVGSSSMSRSRGVLVASANAVSVSKVSLSYEGAALTPGATVTATATDADGNDVTSSEGVTWSWYTAESSSSYATKTKIDLASGSSFAVPKDGAAAYLGKYLFASADGGFGEVYSTASSKITIPGAVTLYQVTASGTAKVGQTLSATAYKNNSYTQVESTDTVSYQWQYARTSATYDSAFTDIAGAVGKAYEIPESYPDGTSSVGTYLRVVATSDNTVYSTKKPYYGSTQSVSPLGPVTQAGVYTLSSVGLSATDGIGAAVETGTGFNVGNTITPQAMVKKSSYSEEAAPSDAKLTYMWYAADSTSGAGTALTGGYDAATGVLTLTDSLKGKYLYVSATSGDNTVTSGRYLVVGAGEYELLRVTLNPSSGNLYTGDTVRASVQAKTTTSSTYGDALANFDGVSWYVADSAGATGSEWTRLEGVSGAEISVPQEAAGKHLRAVATSGSSTVYVQYRSQVIDANSLAAVAAKLSDTKLYPEDVDGANVNELLAKKIADLGYEGITVSVKSAAARGSMSGSVGGISTETAGNGAVTSFYADFDSQSSWASYNTPRQYDCVFTLSRDGETAVADKLLVTLPWDVSAVEDKLTAEAEALAITYASGDSAASVTQSLTLPYKLSSASGSRKSWSSVDWESSDEVVSVSSNGWSDYTGKVTRSSADKTATLTATISTGGISSYSGGPEDVSITKTFDVVVKADPEKVAAEKKDLQAKVDANFKADNIKVAATGEAADLQNVTSDLQLPTTRTLDIDGKYYEVVYTASEDAITANGYRGVVTQPIEPEAEKTVTLTLTVTSKENPEVTATKSIDVVVQPITNDEIDAAVALMEAAKADFAKALLGKNAGVNEVKSDLDTFYEITSAEDGTLRYARTSAVSTGAGIYLDELPGYDAMSGTSWRTLRSSDTNVISDESIQVTQPEADSVVTVTGNLSYAAFEALAAAHPENAKLQSLVNQQVVATYRVVGTVSHDEPQISVGFELVGADATGADQVWSDGAASVSYGSTAADLIEQQLDELGLAHEAHGAGTESYYLSTITSADGRTLGWDSSTGKFWQLFVNGEVSQVGAGQITLSPGDEVMLYYSAWGASADDAGQAKVTASVKIIGTDAAGKDQTWVAATEVSVPSGSLASDATEKVLDAAGLSYEVQNSWGWFLNSITSKDGRKLETTSDYSKYWQFFINGKMASVGAGSYELQPGDELAWYYAGWNAELPSGQVETNPGAAHPDLDVYWNGFNDAGGGATTTTVSTPTVAKDASWATALITGDEVADGMKSNVSEPLIVDGKIYIVSGSMNWADKVMPAKLRVVDPATGTVEKTVELAACIDSTCRPVYANGIIAVPLAGGYVQAVSASTFETLWVADAVGSGSQSVSTLTASNGYVYVSTVDSLDASYKASSGTVRRFNVLTGALAGQIDNGEAGYYWTGGIVAGDYYLTPDDSGAVKVYSQDLGRLVSSCTITDAGIHSTLVEHDGYYYVVSTDGVLHKLQMTDGTLSQVDSVSVAASSTSTPTFSGDYAFVGGGTSSYGGVLSVVKLSDMSVTRVSQADGAALAGAVQSTPLVSVQDGQTYVYFTVNSASGTGNWPNTVYTSGGGVYLYKLGDAQATEVFEPGDGQHEYCNKSVICDADGNLYYTNDSGYLFKVPGGTEGQKKADGGGSGNAGGNGGGNSGNSGSSGAGVESDSKNNDNVDTAKQTTSAAVAGGYIAASHSPISAAQAAALVNTWQRQTTTSDGSLVDAASAGADGARGGSSDGTLVGTHGGKTVLGRWMLNPIAVAAYLVGIAGLVTALVLFFARRRKDDEEEGGAR